MVLLLEITTTLLSWLNLKVSVNKFYFLVSKVWKDFLWCPSSTLNYCWQQYSMRFNMGFCLLRNIIIDLHLFKAMSLLTAILSLFKFVNSSYVPPASILLLRYLGKCFSKKVVEVLYFSSGSIFIRKVWFILLQSLSG